MGDRVARIDEHARVRRGLEALTEVQQEAIDLAFYEGLTHHQIAERLGIPLGTVKSRVRDGLRRLASQAGVGDG